MVNTLITTVLAVVAIDGWLRAAYERRLQNKYALVGGRVRGENRRDDDRSIPTKSTSLNQTNALERKIMAEPNSNDQSAMRREAIIRAARIAVNCYRWQGEGRAHYLADAMENLGEAVDKFEAAKEEKRVETAAS